jgi:pimeloyl-ACP methyl ester carboxylesterase
MPFATANGIRLYYEWHGAEDGIPVVLVMGLGGDSTAWPFQLAALAPRHRVLVFDNRGAGRSEAPDVAYTTRGMAEDLLGLLGGLGVERAHLLGLSLGGAIAQEAVLAAPKRFVSLQLHATWAGPHPYFQALVGAVRMARLQLGREGFYRALSVWLFTPACFVSQPDLVETVVQRATHHPHPTALHAYLRQTEAALGHDARDRVHLIGCPTLVAVGSQDLITPPVLAEELASRIPGARLRSLPDVGHGAIWEAPEAFNRVCLEFLDGVEL